ncbi:MAG: RluA family pseudouridine synthase [Treponema sp.]|nr:RluA family pseudouridine synthase [Treponema sp.]
MDFKIVKAGLNDSNRRLDKILRIYIKNLPLSQIYKYLRKGLIKLNGKKAKADSKVMQNDEISIAAFILEENQAATSSPEKTEEKENNLLFENPLKIVFENKDLLIIDKAYDCLVHGDKNSLDKQVSAYFSSKNTDSSLSFRPGPLHRLDRKTSGLLAFSMSLQGAKWFSENLKNHKISKKYYSILQGNITCSQKWEDYIDKNTLEGKSKEFHKVKISSEEIDDSKVALTFLNPLGHGFYKGQEITFVELDIRTGRTHQIRAQSSLHKHPLLGDFAYGGLKINEERDFYLQAYKITFPKDDAFVKSNSLPESIQIPLDPQLEKILKASNCKFN